VKKTGVHLDDERKDGLARAAEVTGQSQAESTRDGGDHVAEQGLPRRSNLLELRLNLGADAQARVDQALEAFGH
jgi:hypothetical protein